MAGGLRKRPAQKNPASSAQALWATGPKDAPALAPTVETGSIEPSFEPGEPGVVLAFRDRCQGRPMPIEGILHLVFGPVVEQVDLALLESEDRLT